MLFRSPPASARPASPLKQRSELRRRLRALPACRLIGWHDMPFDYIEALRSPRFDLAREAVPVQRSVWIPDKHETRSGLHDWTQNRRLAPYRNPWQVPLLVDVFVVVLLTPEVP